MNSRPLGPEDVEAVCALVDRDRLPGQPACTPERVAAVLAGRSTADPWWWRDLATMRTVGVEGPDGSLVAAGALGRRSSGDRYLLWLHGGEVPEYVEAALWPLLRGVRRGDPIFAFWSATELSIGLEGLPRGHRPATHEALLARGFTAEDRWLYLTAPAAGGPAPEAPFRRRGAGSEVRLELEADGKPAAAAAELGLPAPGTGVVWWLEVEPEFRRRGLGRQLLRAARSVLAEEGAAEVILLVDHDDPRARDRRPALELYQAEGFTVVDHLWSYRRGEGEAEPGGGRSA
ncbi:MAG TPA: GNAT family N-acetyltransferase [Acidimicrobiia bacterium]|nr:GNAT family N-acetyltransferase [Acidimicrobiia bacterium]